MRRVAVTNVQTRRVGFLRRELLYFSGKRFSGWTAHPTRWQWTASWLLGVVTRTGCPWFAWRASRLRNRINVRYTYVEQPAPKIHHASWYESHGSGSDEPSERVVLVLMPPGDGES